MTLGSAFGLLKRTYGEWKEDDASTKAAALSYYALFSLGPLLLIAIVVAGLVFGEAAARGQVAAQMEGLLGPQGAQALQAAIDNSRRPGATTISALIGVAGLLWSASGLFGQLQRTLNAMWGVREDPNAGMLGTLKKRLVSMTMVLGVGFLLLVSLVLSAAVSVVGQYFADLLPGGELLWQAVNFALSFLVVTLLFAAIYKVLPDATVAWRDVWIGAAVTSLLFAVGKLLIGLYLGHASVGSAYGAAGSVVILLVWVYYSAQILFFGAEFTQVYARTHGSRVVPAEGAVPLASATSRARSLSAAAHGRGNRTTGAGRSPAGTCAPVSRGPRSGPVKTLLWAGLAAGTTAAAGLLARRGSAAIWWGLVHETPPTREV
jgi:membrane protein